MNYFGFSCVMMVHACELLWIFMCYDSMLKEELPPTKLSSPKKNGSREPSLIFITTKFVSFIRKYGDIAEVIICQRVITKSAYEYGNSISNGC